MPVCVLFVCCRSGIVFNSSDGAITDHSQSEKGIDPYLSLCSMWMTPATESRYSFTELAE